MENSTIYTASMTVQTALDYLNSRRFANISIIESRPESPISSDFSATLINKIWSKDKNQVSELFIREIEKHGGNVKMVSFS